MKEHTVSKRGEALLSEAKDLLQSLEGFSLPTSHPVPKDGASDDTASASSAAMAQNDKVIERVLQANKEWAQGFDKPMKLGVEKKLTVLTCMDSRLIPEQFLGLDIGDAEIIRNGGGRVTPDVLRSMIICWDLLECDHMLVIHHTDCGGQALVRRKEDWQRHMYQDISKYASLPVKALFYSFWWTSYLVPPIIRRAVENILARPIRDLPESVVEDVKLLRMAPHIPPHLKLYGLLYSTETGRLTEMCRDEGGGLILTDAYRQAKQQDGGIHQHSARQAPHQHGVGGKGKKGGDDKSGHKGGQQFGGGKGGGGGGEDGKSDKTF